MYKKKMVIVGGCGTIGKKLNTEWPDAVSIDRAEGADLVFDLCDLGSEDSRFYNIVCEAEIVIHLATSADPDAPDLVHFQSLENSAKLINACAKVGVRKLILASSDWAEPTGFNINSYGYSKRIIEIMAEMYSHQQHRVATALRIGWVPDDLTNIHEAPTWLRKNYWDDLRLISEFKKTIAIEPI